MTDPYRCLRCSTISIAIYNIVYCLVQFGVLGWQVQAVKGLQWEYENRQLPATGGIDAYQARFPGLYAIYTETPERRRINAMYAIVLICLFLSIIHLMTTVALLYGAIKRLPNWIIPWFFTCAPLVIMCTAYSVLWWSGDVFNEQLTMSVAEFVGSLAVNGVCFIVVIMYYLRLTGRLSSDKPKPSPSSSRSTYIAGGQYPGDRQRHYQTSVSPNRHIPDNVPPWKQEWPEEAPYNLQKKMRRRERDRERSPAAALRQGYPHSTARLAGMTFMRHRGRPSPTTINLEQQRSQSMLDLLPLGACAQTMESYQPLPSRLASSLSPPMQPATSFSEPIYPRSSSTPMPQPPPLYPKPLPKITRPPSTNEKTTTTSPSKTSPRRGVIAPIQMLDSSPRKKSRSAFTRSQIVNLRAKSTENKDSSPRQKTQSAFTRSQIAILRRKSPQRVSFKSKPRIYERTPDSSLSGSGQRPGEMHTVVFFFVRTLTGSQNNGLHLANLTCRQCIWTIVLLQIVAHQHSKHFCQICSHWLAAVGKDTSTHK